MSKVKLALSSGNQVFEDMVLQRKKGARLYQLGIHGYQNLPREERKQFLLIDGQRTVELDYVSLHPSMLLNRMGKESPKTDMYSRLLKELGIRKTKERRKAIKDAVLIALNIGTVRGFCSYLGRERKAYRQHLKGLVKPKDIHAAIVKLYPELEPYVCTSKHHGRRLQKLDSEIMVDVLESLAKMGIVALPEHDSVIALREHKETIRDVMKDIYEWHMGFEIGVK